jgi:hypothetical protein
MRSVYQATQGRRPLAQTRLKLRFRILLSLFEAASGLTIAP